MLVSNGRRDPLTTRAITTTLVDGLRARGARVSERHHPGGHGVDTDALDEAARFLRDEPTTIDTGKAS